MQICRRKRFKIVATDCEIVLLKTITDHEGENFLIDNALSICDFNEQLRIWLAIGTPGRKPNNSIGLERTQPSLMIDHDS